MTRSARMDLLEGEFRRIGMAPDAAGLLSCDAVIRHPIAHRLGVPDLARRMTAHGAAPDQAAQLALALWGVERLGHGACYGDLLGALRRIGVADAEAIPACMTSCRLWRELSEAGPDEDLDLQLARWCAVFLGVLALVSALAQLPV